MPKEKAPKLTEAQIRAMATEQSFARGKSYYNDGAIINPMRQGMELSAECEGSDYEPYQLRVTLSARGVAEADCDCPYEYGGLCKHLVALLLTYVREPQAFRVVQPVERLLAGKSKEELIAIVAAMVKREPKLLAEVELAAATEQAKPGKPMDVTAPQRQARRAMGLDSPRAIEKDLKSLRDTAARLLKSGDALNAGAIYHAVLAEAVRGYDEMVMSMDEDGDICIVIDEIAQGLGEALKKGQPDAATRQAWLEALLEAELADIELGGIDLAPSARDIIMKQATAGDWQWIEQRLRK
ncbi:MAG TPA: SWIM zinc finger family protein, partial [Candidatus Obscuribacterales bacterium]